MIGSHLRGLSWLSGWTLLASSLLPFREVADIRHQLLARLAGISLGEAGVRITPGTGHRRGERTELAQALRDPPR
jgi:hypothetical protein